MGCCAAKEPDQAPEREFVLVVGTKDVGKSTLMNRMRLGEVKEVTMEDFRVETVDYKHFTFYALDLGFRLSEREEAFVRLYHSFRVSAVLFLLDSTNKNFSLVEQSETYNAPQIAHKLLSDNHLQDAVFLFMCTKQDLVNTMKPEDLFECLDIRELEQMRYKERIFQDLASDAPLPDKASPKYFATGARLLEGKGVYETLEQMYKAVRKFRSWRKRNKIDK